MKTNFLSNAYQQNIQSLLDNHNYDDCKKLIMDLKHQLHIMYADIEKIEKDYLNTKQLNLF